MSNKENNSTNNVPYPLGGLAISWYLGDDPKTITTKNGDVRTIIELRDPMRLARSISIWMDGDDEALQGVRPGAVISLHLSSARSGQGRNELVAEVERPSVEAAFERAREQA